VVVIEIPADEEEGTPAQRYVLCNPEIVKTSGEETDEEGCLSLPGYVGEVARAAAATVKGFTAEGKPIRVKGHGLLARVLQHELDHLDGVLFTDRLESMDKLRRLGEPEEETPVG
jgi:peptide deformylase